MARPTKEEQWQKNKTARNNARKRLQDHRTGCDKCINRVISDPVCDEEVRLINMVALAETLRVDDKPKRKSFKTANGGT